MKLAPNRKGRDAITTLNSLVAYSSLTYPLLSILSGITAHSINRCLEESLPWAQPGMFHDVTTRSTPNRLVQP